MQLSRILQRRTRIRHNSYLNKTHCILLGVYFHWQTWFFFLRRNKPRWERDSSNSTVLQPFPLQLLSQIFVKISYKSTLKWWNNLGTFSFIRHKGQSWLLPSSISELLVGAIFKEKSSDAELTPSQLCRLNSADTAVSCYSRLPPPVLNPWCLAGWE